MTSAAVRGGSPVLVVPVIPNQALDALQRAKRRTLFFLCYGVSVEKDAAEGIHRLNLGDVTC